VPQPGDQVVQVVRVRGEVVEAVGGDRAVAEPAQVGHQHLEAGARERLDVARPDAFRLGPAVGEEERDAADTLAPIRQLHV
jgi:hypothetical protein